MTRMQKSAQRQIAHARQILGIALRERWPVGHHLVEQNLVSALGVSRTPVRAALGHLEGLGIVQALRNHGYFLAMDPDQIAALDLEVPNTLEDDVYIAMITARVKGSGPQAFSLSDVMQVHGVRRTLAQRVVSRIS